MNGLRNFLLNSFRVRKRNISNVRRYTDNKPTVTENDAEENTYLKRDDEKHEN